MFQFFKNQKSNWCTLNLIGVNVNKQILVLVFLYVMDQELKYLLAERCQSNAYCFNRPPYYAMYIDKLKTVQHHFLGIMAISFGFPDPFSNHDYKAFSEQIKIPTLQFLRRTECLLFLYKICNNMLDLPKILGYLRLHVPSRSTRSISTFEVARKIYSYLDNSTIYGITRT